MIASYLDLILFKQLAAIENELCLEVPEGNRILLQGCRKRAPRLTRAGLALGVFLIELWPVTTRLQTFSALSAEQQKHFLKKYRHSKLSLIAGTIQFMQTHVVLAAYERQGFP